MLRLTDVTRPSTAALALISLLVGNAELMGQSATAKPDSYRLSARADSVRVIHVDARLRLRDSTVFMVPWGAEHLPDGWRTYVHGEAATDASGRTIPLRRIADRKWVVGAPAGSTIALRYVVDIQHDTAMWVPNVREAAYAFPDRAFIVGRGLFILPSLDMVDTRITLDVPRGWLASVPWDSAGPQAYSAATRRDLVESTVEVGRFTPITVSDNGFSLDFAIGNEFAAAVPVFEDVARKVLREHLATFGGPPTWTRMQLIINSDPQHRDEGGGVFRRSISMTFRQVPSPQGIPGWGHTISHEIFHVWNAFTITRGSTAEEWWIEGGGDYWGVLALARTGLISRDVLFMKLRRAYSQYRQAAGTMSLAAAGEHESDRVASNLLYNGGWCLLMGLDADIRARTNGVHSLDDVLRDLRAATVAGRMAGVANDSLVASLRRVTGQDYKDFFARYVTGKEPIPFGQLVRGIGLTLDGDGLVVDPSASPEAKARLEAYFKSTK